MRFPKVIRHRNAEVTIYGKKPNYPFYRIAYRVAGKRHLRNFSKYGEALKEADKKVRELASGSQAAALTADQSRDALAAIERLEALQQSIGRRVSLLAAVSEFAEASTKLQGRNLSEVVEAYRKTQASVNRKTISEAVEEFIAMRQPLTEAQAGKRAQLSKNYAYLVGLWLRDFAKTFPSDAVSDLGKEHLNLFMQKYAKHSPRSRNHYRGAVKMFLTWCVKRDYLSPAHRLGANDSAGTWRVGLNHGCGCEPNKRAGHQSILRIHCGCIGRERVVAFSSTQPLQIGFLGLLVIFRLLPFLRHHSQSLFQE
jgi:hypothetical protein